MCFLSVPKDGIRVAGRADAIEVATAVKFMDVLRCVVCLLVASVTLSMRIGRKSRYAVRGYPSIG